MAKYPLLGKLAIKNKFLLKEDIDKALSVCSRDGDNLDKELSRYFISNKLISSKNIEKLVASIKEIEQIRPEVRFGAIAVKKGLVSKTNLDFIIEEQENDIINSREAKLLGDMLIEAGLITKGQRDSLIEAQKKILEKIPAKKRDDEEKKSLLMEAESVSCGLKLQISSDFLSAYLIKTEDFDEDCSIDDIEDILNDKDIIFGVVANEMTNSFLKSNVLKGKPFRVAQGLKPVYGKDADINYFFNTEPLRAGGVGTDGQIDFKDRGRIPQVEKEMVLVEKTPMIESIPGKNIYGEIISVKPSVDCEIKIGKGVELSMNGLQASATVQGYPEISSTGEVCVLDIYILEGDVDYETGHVEHEGDIEIRGCIKSGFKVKGHNIKANAIDDGIIEAKGNLEILNGINSGKIHVTGDVSAKFIHKSDITCAGEVSVAKEIIDAVIKNRGKCSMANGKIISSDISSKMGVFVKDIGTEKGIPSNIRVGFDMFSEKELQMNQISLEDYNKTLVEMVNDQEKKTDEKEKFTKRIDEYTQIKSDLQISHQNIISKIESLKKSGNALDSPEAIKEKTDKLQAEMKQVVDKLEFYVGSKNELEKQIKALTQKIGKHKLKIKNIEFERESILKWIEDNPGKTVVTASGIIMEKTIIHGLNSRKVLDEEVRNVKLNETRDTKPGAGPNAYKIEIFH